MFYKNKVSGCWLLTAFFFFHVFFHVTGRLTTIASRRRLRIGKQLELKDTQLLATYTCKLRPPFQTTFPIRWIIQSPERGGKVLFPHSRSFVQAASSSLFELGKA